MPQFGEFGAAMIQSWHVHGPQHPIGHVGGAWNLQKMPTSVQGHMASFPGVFWLRKPLEYHYLTGLSPARRGSSMHKKQGFALPRRTPAGMTL